MKNRGMIKWKGVEHFIGLLSTVADDHGRGCTASYCVSWGDAGVRKNSCNISCMLIKYHRNVK